MAEKARIAVDVDTRKARAELASLNKNKRQAQKRISSAGKRASRVAVRAFAFTGAASTFGKFNDNQPSGNTDVFGEAMVPYFAKWQEYQDAELGFSAKARKTAREETKAAFAYTVGQTGQTAGMREFFNAASRIQEDVESGRNLVRQDPRFIGPDASTAAKTAVKGNLKLFFQNVQSISAMRLLQRGFDYVVEGIEAE